MTKPRKTGAPRRERVRDVLLPVGLSRVRFEELAALFNEKAHPDCDYTCDEMAVRAFEVLRPSHE